MSRRIALLVSLLVCGSCPPVHAQRTAADILLGARWFSDGTGMLVLEARAARSPRGWPVRPSLGVAAATNIYGGSQLEFMWGAQGDVRAGRFLTLSGSGGISHLSEDISGRKVRGTRPFLQGAMLITDRKSDLHIGLDARYRAAPGEAHLEGARFVQLALTLLSVRASR